MKHWFRKTVKLITHHAIDSQIMAVQIIIQTITHSVVNGIDDDEGNGQKLSRIFHADLQKSSIDVKKTHLEVLFTNTNQKTKRPPWIFLFSCCSRLSRSGCGRSLALLMLLLLLLLLYLTEGMSSPLVLLLNLWSFSRTLLPSGICKTVYSFKKRTLFSTLVKKSQTFPPVFDDIPAPPAVQGTPSVLSIKLPYPNLSKRCMTAPRHERGARSRRKKARRIMDTSYIYIIILRKKEKTREAQEKRKRSQGWPKSGEEAPSKSWTAWPVKYAYPRRNMQTLMFALDYSNSNRRRASTVLIIVPLQPAASSTNFQD